MAIPFLTSDVIMAFRLFILLNAVLFLRPGELVAELGETSVYEVVILVCLVASAPRVLRQLRPGALIARPETLCVLGLLAAVVASHLAQGNVYAVRLSGVMFLKVVLYYLLLVGVVDSATRLRQFLTWLGVLFLGMTLLSLAQYHGAIDIPALAPIEQPVLDPDTGEVLSYPRLCGPGIFHDPNDLSLVLVWGILICLQRMDRGGIGRVGWAGMIGVFAYALTLTHSRGGFLALAISVLVLLHARFRGVKAVGISLVALAAMVVVFGGRQTSFNFEAAGDTGQQRILLWSDGLAMLRNHPVFGAGQGTYAEQAGLVAHNSFVEAFAELGFAGGTLFLGAFAYSLFSLHRLGGSQGRAVPPAQARLRPYLMAMATSMVVGMLSLSRLYTLTPYIVLGLSSVYLRETSARAPAASPRLTPGLAVAGFVVAVVFLAATYAFILTFARWE